MTKFIVIFFPKFLSWRLSAYVRHERTESCQVATREGIIGVMCANNPSADGMRSQEPSAFSERELLITELAAVISRRQQSRILRVAVDGVDGAGKTTFADELAQTLRARGAVVIRASVDGFHFPKAVRYRLGHTSPEGFFLDSYDYSALKEALLDPLSPSGSGRYRVATFDLDADMPILMAEAQSPSEAILVLDGIFMHRPELRAYWDFSVFLDVAFSTSIPRGAQRGPGYGSPDPSAMENRRYVEGQKLYLQTCEPKQWATLTINNDDLTTPYLVSDSASSRRTTSS